MKRKLFLGLLAAAAVLFTACQKDQTLSEVTEDNTAIGFGTYVGRDAQTKATVANLESLETSGFGVFTFYTADALSQGVHVNNTPDFMHNVQVSGTDWSYDNTKYWPQSGYLSFYAYAPFNNSTGSNISAVSNITDSGIPHLTFTVPAEVSDQTDLLYADPLMNLRNGNGTDGKVKFTFNHALSRIAFSVETGAGLTVTVNDITLTGKFNISGSMKLSDGTITATTQEETIYNLNYSNNTSSENNKASGGSAPIISKNDGYLMIIPINFANYDNESDKAISVKVNYKIEDISGEYTYEANGSISGFNFEKGKAYLFKLKLNPYAENPIEFDEPIISDWGTETTSTFNPNSTTEVSIP